MSSKTGIKNENAELLGGDILISFEPLKDACDLSKQHFPTSKNSTFYTFKEYLHWCLRVMGKQKKLNFIHCYDVEAPERAECVLEFDTI